jgi:hypothetical protein
MVAKSEPERAAMNEKSDAPRTPYVTPRVMEQGTVVAVTRQVTPTGTPTNSQLPGFDDF